MSRPLRIQYNGAWYHVMNRGAQRKPIFRNRKHRIIFLDLLAEIVETYKIEIHAYCLMGNHYHLLIHTPYGNLSKAMQRLGSVYTIKYNISQNIDGPLFRGRYKSQLVQDDSYALHLVRYIHLNPLRAGIIEQLSDYEWSSYNIYLKPSDKPDWLTTNLIENHFQNRDYLKSFQAFTFEETPENIMASIADINTYPIIGSEQFIEKVKHEVSYHVLSSEIADRNFLRPSIDKIIEDTSKEFNVDISMIKTAKKGSNLPRSCVILIAKKHYNYKLTEISEIMGIKRYKTVSSAALKFESIIEENNMYRNKYNRILELLNDHI